jgi:hypothetical protein
MNLDRQTHALLELVDADRRAKCDAILAEARSRRRALLTQAHAEARSRMRKAFDEERSRRDARVAAARANLQTRRRLADQQHAAALLAAGWKALPVELLRRWHDPALRHDWVAAVIAAARAVLTPPAWRVIHGPGWPETEREALRAELAAATRTECEFVDDTRIRAGLLIAANGNIVDGTLDGLLADRAEIGARLLHLLDTAAGVGAGP